MNIVMKFLLPLVRSGCNAEIIDTASMAWLHVILQLR